MVKKFSNAQEVMPPNPLVSCYQLGAQLLQKKIGETLCYKNFGCVGRTMSFLAEANKGTKKM